VLGEEVRIVVLVWCDPRAPLVASTLTRKDEEILDASLAPKKETERLSSEGSDVQFSFRASDSNLPKRETNSIHTVTLSFSVFWNDARSLRERLRAGASWLIAPTSSRFGFGSLPESSGSAETIGRRASARTSARITMMSATSTVAPVVARTAWVPAAARPTRGAVGSQSVSRGNGAHRAIWRVTKSASSPANGRASLVTRASLSRGASKRRSRRDRPPALRASSDGTDEASASAENAGEVRSDESTQFKTGLSADPAFEAALASVSDMASTSSEPSSAEKPRELTKEDFVAPTIDWGDTIVRKVKDDSEKAVTYSASQLSEAYAPAVMANDQSSSTSSFAERAMAQSASDGFVPAEAFANPAPGMEPLGLREATQQTALATSAPRGLAALAPPPEKQAEQVRSFLYPGEEELPDDVNMTLWEHLEELRDRALISAGACTAMILICFCFAKDLVIFLEAPVADSGVRFLQLGPGEYFFTTVKVAGYCGLLLGAPVVLYEAIAYVLPGLTKDERKFLGPIVLGSSILFYLGIYFAYSTLTPAALNFFIGYSSDAVESLWSIDQYFEFVLVLLFSTGLSFQVPVIQLLLGQTGIVTSKQMLSVWRYVVVGSVVAAAVLTPSTDPFTQMLLAVPLMSLYLGGAAAVGLVEKGRGNEELPDGSG